MDIREALLQEHSKAQTSRIVEYIGTDTERLDILIHLFLYDEYRICQRAAWAVGDIGEKYPELIEPYLEKMLKNLDNNVHPAIIRNTVRVLSNLKKVSDSTLGLALDKCFRYLESPTVPVAIRVYAMRFLYKASLKEPDLKTELKILIEDFLEYEKPFFVAAGRDILRKMAKK